MAFTIAEEQKRGLLYLGLRGTHELEFDGFGCFYEDAGKIVVFYYLMNSPDGSFSLYETRLPDLIRLPNIEWYLVKRVKPFDTEDKRIPTKIDVERTNELYKRFQRFIAVNFSSSLQMTHEHPVIVLEKKFRDKMADQFYRGEFTIVDTSSSPRPESPKADPLTGIYDDICRLREDVIKQDSCSIRLNSLISNVNQIINGRLPPIGPIPGRFDKDCVIEVRPLRHGVKVKLSSGKRVNCDEPEIFRTLTNEELHECLRLIDIRSTERDQMTDIKKEIVDQIVENEK